jgi:hypothetical protein
VAELIQNLIGGGIRGPRGAQGVPGTVDGITILTGEADPTAGAGVEAAQPAIYFRTTGGASTLWLKTSAADTAWTQLVTATFAGAITAPQFVGSSAGSNTAPTFTWTGTTNTGVYSESSGVVSFTAGGTRYARVRSAGVDILNTALNAMHTVVWSNVNAPTALDANANNYGPTNLSNASTLLQDASEDVAITGITGGVAGRMLAVVNVSASNTITLAHESEDSTAANRFLLPTAGNLPLLPGQGVMLLYVGSASRWRALAWGEPNIV